MFKDPLILKPGIAGIKNISSLGLVLIGILGQALADAELQDFKEEKKQGKITAQTVHNTGLWEKSRHPNLFFELVTWFGIAAFGINGLSSAWALSGPCFLYLIMDRLTIPLTTKSMKSKRGSEYVEYLNSTNKFWPF